MPTVSSTDGSPTNTCWKRRSSAASFSMYLRYSSSVVAPTSRSSPRASIGLIMLPASIDDSPVAPAPTMVCSSSMNVMIWPAEFLMSSSTALSRSSNSPRYFDPGDHRAEVERDDGLVAQALRHVARDDALGQALDDRGLADARLADQHRVVLGATAQHLHDATNLVVAPDNRVELAFAGAGGQVGGVLLQRLVGALGVGAGDAGAAAHLDERVAQRLRRRAVAGEQLGRITVAGGQTDHQVLGRDVLVVHLGGEVLGSGDRGERLARQLRRRAGAAGAGQPVEEPLRLGPDGRGFDADGLQQGGGNAIVLSQQCHQQVGGHDLRVARGGGRLQRRGQRRLGLGRRVERVHDSSVPSRRDGKMLVVMFNAVKVESVPLNFNLFAAGFNVESAGRS